MALWILLPVLHKLLNSGFRVLGLLEGHWLINLCPQKPKLAHFTFSLPKVSVLLSMNSASTHVLPCTLYQHTGLFLQSNTDNKTNISPLSKATQWRHEDAFQPELEWGFFFIIICKKCLNFLYLALGGNRHSETCTHTHSQDWYLDSVGHLELLLGPVQSCLLMVALPGHGWTR